MQTTGATVSSYEAKTKLPELLRRAAGGERIIITRRGQPMAELVPIAKPQAMTVDQAISQIRKLGSRHSLKGLSIREMIEDGRR